MKKNMDILDIKSWFGGNAPEPTLQQPINTTFENYFVNFKDIGFSSKEINDKKLVFDGYITNGDVYSIVNRISQSISDLEIELYKYNKKDKVEIESGEWYDLFRTPNTIQSWKDFSYSASLNLCLTGDLFIQKIRLGNKIISFKVLKSIFVTIETGANNEITGYSYTLNGKYEKIVKDDMIHIKHENPYTDTHYGLSPLQAGYLSLQTSNECNLANANLLANRGVSAIVSSPTSDNAMSMTATDAEKIQRAIKKRIGGSTKANSVTVTSAQIEVHELGMSASDLEIVRSQEITLRQLARIYGANSQIFGDTSSSTYNNMNEAMKSFYNNCVLPILGKITRGIENNLRQEITEFKSIEIEICKDEIECLQEDQKLKIEKQNLLSTGITDVLTKYNTNQLTKEQAEEILLSVYSLDTEQVQKLIKVKPIQNTNE